MLDVFVNFFQGIIVTVPQMELTVNVKVAVLLGTTDLQGKAYVVNMTQHNGESGCVTCEETGIVVTQGKGHTRCYPYRSPMERAPKRTTETLLENAFQVNERQRKVVFNENNIVNMRICQFTLQQNRAYEQYVYMCMFVRLQEWWMLPA